jgi:hypothetical protein
MERVVARRFAARCVTLHAYRGTAGVFLRPCARRSPWISPARPRPHGPRRNARLSTLVEPGPDAVPEAEKRLRGFFAEPSPEPRLVSASASIRETGSPMPGRGTHQADGASGRGDLRASPVGPRRRVSSPWSHRPMIPPRQLARNESPNGPCIWALGGGRRRQVRDHGEPRDRVCATGRRCVSWTPTWAAETCIPFSACGSRTEPSRTS